MRIDGAAKAEPGQQTQSRFEQVMSRELSRNSEGRTQTESTLRTALTAASGKDAPKSERVGVEFKAEQASKALKNLQDSLRSALSKAGTMTAEGSKNAFAKLDGALKDGSLKTALGGMKETAGQMLSKSALFLKDGAQAASSKLDGALKEGGLKAALGDMQEKASQTPSKTATAITEGAKTAFATKGDASGLTTTQPSSDARTPGGPAGQGSSSTPSVLVSTTPVATLRTDAQATLITPETGMAAPVATGATADAAAIQDGRAALATPESGTPHEAFLLHGPGLMGVARRAKETGSVLKSVYMLGPNAQGADFVSITNDGKGFITGPEIDIALTDGGIDATGFWSAGIGKGTIRGAQVSLIQNEEGCAFAFDGADDVPQQARAWFENGDTLSAEITATREMT